MIRHLLVCLLTVTMLSASILGVPQVAFAAPAPMAKVGAASPVLLVPGEDELLAVAAPAKRCKRGATPSSRCGADIGLPVFFRGIAEAACAAGIEMRSRTITGLSPACLVGPPRSA